MIGYPEAEKSEAHVIAALREQLETEKKRKEYYRVAFGSQCDEHADEDISATCVFCDLKAERLARERVETLHKGLMQEQERKVKAETIERCIEVVADFFNRQHLPSDGIIFELRALDQIVAPGYDEDTIKARDRVAAAQGPLTATEQAPDSPDQPASAAATPCEDEHCRIERLAGNPDPHNGE